MTTSPSRSTSRSSCCASAPSPGASRPRGPASCARPGSNSTRRRGWRPVTGGRWTCRSRSSPSSRRCCTPALRSFPRKVSLRQRGTRTPTRSPLPSPSPSAACAASSATLPSLPPPQASATASPDVAAGRLARKFLPGPAAADARRALGHEVGAWPCVIVADLDEDPATRTGPGQCEDAPQLVSTQDERHVTWLVPHDIGGAFIPDDHCPAAAPVTLVHPLEVTGGQRVILHRHGQPADYRVE